MRILTLILLTIIYLNADFISKYEHGQKLYQNPRGIACAGCHGANAKGKTLADFYRNGTSVTIKAPDITGIPVTKLHTALTKGRSVMPVYRLTDEEIEALYLYLNTNEATE